MATIQYTIGDESRPFLDALFAFQAFKDTFFNALQHQYGEDDGADIFHRHNDLLTDVERAVMDYLRIQFSMQMGVRDKNGVVHIEL